MFYQPSPIKYDIMGSFKFIPLMQCRHSIYSMSHRIDGEITINGKVFSMDRTIHESASCTAHYTFSHKGRMLCDFIGNRASFEFEYKTKHIYST